MAQPNRRPRRNQPLLDVLAQVGLTVAEMNAILKDGAEEAERLIPKLIEQNTTGGKVKAAQLALISREVRAMQSALWGELGRVTRSGVVAATLKAADSAEDVLLRIFNRNRISTEDLLAGWQQAARQGIQAVLSKSANGIPLSRAVYRTQALASGQVDRILKRGLLLNMNAKAIAKSVRDLIDPKVRGGVSYAAHRLARTEINNAYRTSQERRYQGEPWTQGMRWNLSGSHPAPDICNILAAQSIHSLGPGVYPVGQRPNSHPNCLCYLTPEQVDEDEFVVRLMAGQYDEYLSDDLDIDVPDFKRAVTSPTPFRR